MEDGGFKVVTRRKGKLLRKRSGHDSFQRIEGSLDDIRLALQNAGSQIKDSGLSSWVISEIKSILENRRLREVYVVGNGHFDAPWEPGAHQLALVMELCREFQAMMIFQEPCLSKAEREWLSKQHQVVSRDASDVLLECSDNADSIQLVVLIHGGTTEVEQEFVAISVYRKVATFVRIPEYTPHPSFFLSSSIVYVGKDVVLPDLKM